MVQSSPSRKYGGISTPPSQAINTQGLSPARQDTARTSSRCTPCPQICSCNSVQTPYTTCLLHGWLVKLLPETVVPQAVTTVKTNEAVPVLQHQHSDGTLYMRALVYATAVNFLQELFLNFKSHILACGCSI